MREKFRDKTRDEYTDAMNALGVPAAMAERGRPEEKVRKDTFRRSLGIVDLADAPFPWVNVVKQDGSQYSPPRWWFVYCVPDDSPQDLRSLDLKRSIDVKASRQKSFPLFGRVTGVRWEGDDQGTGVIAALSADARVKALAKKANGLAVAGYNQEFQGWTLEVERREPPTRQDWQALLFIAACLLPPPEEEPA